MARNRKRRRTRPPGTNPDPRQGLPTATHDFGATDSSEREAENGAAELEPVDLHSDAFDEAEGAPPPLEHAMPDAELAEEQVEVGRPDEPEPEEGEDEEEFEREVEESIASTGGGGRGPRRRGRRYDGEGGVGASGGGELATTGTTAVAEHPGIISRLIAFLQGSWRELQRVQWPDRRQVFQATGVVIGFVIVAAVFLGVADWAAGKIVTFVLK